VSGQLLTQPTRVPSFDTCPLCLLQDFSLDARKELNIQAPAQNLIAMAMHGSRNFLGVWDVDEYLMLPGHQPIMHEVRPLPFRTHTPRTMEHPLARCRAPLWNEPLAVHNYVMIAGGQEVWILGLSDIRNHVHCSTATMLSGRDAVGGCRS
jgi:hypothetical protein